MDVCPRTVLGTRSSRARVRRGRVVRVVDRQRRRAALVDPPTTAFIVADRVRAWFAARTRLPISTALGRLGADLSEHETRGDRVRRSALRRSFRLRFRRDRTRARTSATAANRMRGASTITQQTAKNLFLWSRSELDPQRTRSVFHAVDRNVLAKDADSRGISQHRRIRTGRVRRRRRERALLSNSRRRGSIDPRARCSRRCCRTRRGSASRRRQRTCGRGRPGSCSR